ncbi:MAG TPA: LptA/OstA family protein [bacterium]|nr:LptA/OstA family protein [bacterium]HPP30046.1 LptA/OstA family protein [bacterium]
MGGHIKKVSGIIIILLLLTYGCTKKEENKISEKPEEEIKHFTLKQFADNKGGGFVLEGESAEISSGGASMTTPQLSFSTGTESIEITTGKEGSGEIKIDPDEKKVKTIIITGNIKIVYRDLKTKDITMEGSCKKLTYNEIEKTIIMEVSPVIKRGNNYFSGDVMYYNLEKNSLDIKGNVNAQIYTEKGTH